MLFLWELRSILLFVFEKSSAQLELWTKKEQRKRYNFHESRYPTTSPVTIKNGCIFQGCRFGVSRTWKSNCANLYQPIVWKKSANVKGKQICKNRTTSRWNPNFFQPSHALPPRWILQSNTKSCILCGAEQAGDESEEKNVNDKNNQTITEEHDKSFVPWRCLATWKNTQLHVFVTVKVEFKCRKRSWICENLND